MLKLLVVINMAHFLNGILGSLVPKQAVQMQLLPNAGGTAAPTDALDVILAVFKTEFQTSVGRQFGEVKAAMVAEINERTSGLVKQAAGRQEKFNANVLAEVNALKAQRDAMSQAREQMRLQM